MKKRPPKREIKLRKYYPTLNPKPPDKPQEFVGLDTETCNGYVGLIADSNERVYELPDTKDPEPLLEWLTHRSLENKILVWYNMTFDIDSILKILPKEKMDELNKTGQTQINLLYKLELYEKKMFTIKKASGFDKKRGKIRWRSFNFFDIAQFFQTSLDKAARQYLGKQKIDFDVKETSKNWKIFKEKLPEMRDYCIMDAKLTQELGEFFQNNLKQAVGIYFPKRRYMSEASLSKYYYSYNCDLIPPQHLRYKFTDKNGNKRKLPKQLENWSYLSYRGGWFECVKKGRIPDVTQIDIVSAYPAAMTEMVDYRNNPDGFHLVIENKRNRDSLFGFYKVTVKTKPDTHISPVGIRDKDTIINPVGEITTWITHYELESIINSGIEVIIHKGLEYFDPNPVYPLKETTENLYKQKERFKKHKHTDFRYKVYKKMLNAFYGTNFEYHEQIDPDEREIIDYIAGTWWNPPWASLITGYCRAKCWDVIANNQDKIIAIMTDGILFTGKLRPGDYTIKQKGEGGLGDWEYEKKNAEHGIIIKSGIYKLANEKPKQRGILYNVTGEGGIKTPYGNQNNIFEYIQNYPNLTEYPYTINRPIHRKEALKNKEYNIEDINTFKDIERNLDLNTERKRIHTQEITGKDILTKTIESYPYRTTKTTENWFKQKLITTNKEIW